MSEAGTLAPVGTKTAPFAGNYDGGGFSIANATINGVTSEIEGNKYTVAGVFGVLVGGGSISNLRVTNVSVTATGGNGGLDQAYAGGLVAFAEDCTITDCSVSGSTITASGSNNFAGAFVGFAGAENSEKTAFSKCASENNTVNTYDYGGGFIGAIVNTTDDDAISFTDCYSAKNTATSTGYYEIAGAFLGDVQGELDKNAIVKNCFVYSCDAVVKNNSKGGLFVGSTQYGTISTDNCFYYDANSLASNNVPATSKTAEEMKSLASMLGEPFTQGADYPVLLHSITLTVSIDG